MPSTDLAVKPLALASAAIAPLGKDRLAQLSALHLHGMATAWSELLAEGPRRPMQPEAWLDRLIEAELADRCAFRRLQPSIPIEASPLFRTKPAGHSDDPSRVAVWFTSGVKLA